MGMGSCARSARRRPAQEHRPATTSDAAKKIKANFKREGGAESPEERIPAKTKGAKKRPPRADTLVRKTRRRRMGMEGARGRGPVENSTLGSLRSSLLGTGEPSLGLFFRGGSAGEGGGDAQRDEHAAGDVALGAQPAGVGAEAAGDCAGKDRPQRVACGAHTGEQNAEREDLCGDVSSRRVDELGEEGEEEERGLWIEDVNHDALREDAGEGGAWGVGRSFEGFVAPQLLYAEVDEIGGAEIFNDAEGGGGRDEKSGEADGGCGGVDESADADAERGNQAGVAALADAASDDVKDGWAGDGEKQCGGADED